MKSNFNIDDDSKISGYEEELLALSKEIQQNYPFTLIDQQNFQLKIDNFQSVVWLEDAYRKIILFNKKFSQRFDAEEFSSPDQSSDELILNIKALMTPLSECIENTIEPTSIKQKIRKADGKNLILNIFRIPLVSEDGRVILTMNEIVLFEDGEAYREIVQRKQDGKSIVQSTTKQYMTLDSDYRILEISDGLLELIHYSWKEVIGLPMQKIFTDEVQKIVMEFDSLQSESMEKVFEGLLSQKNIRYFSGRIFVTLLPGKLKNYLISFINSVQPNETVKILGIQKMIDSLMQNNPEPIYIFDKENLNFLDANKAATELYGYTKEEFLQMDITDLYLPEDIQSLLESSDEKQDISFFSGPFRHRKKDGSLILVEISKNSWQHEGRESYLNLIKDVTSVKNLEKKIQLFKNVFDNTDDLLFVTDVDGIISYANNSTVKALGYSKEDIENSAFSSLIVDEDRANVNANIFHSYLKDSITLVTALKKSDDSQLQVELTASPVLDYKGEIDSFSLIATFGKGVQAETREVIKEIVKEVKIEKPVRLNHQVKESDESAFLSSLFHQILTPINVIMGFIQELAESLPSLNSDQKEMVDIINQNRSTLLNTMNSFVEYSNIVQQKYELSLSQTRVTDLVDDLQKNFQEISGSDKIELAYGKISSSLEFESDGKKLNTFIAQLVKIILKLNKPKKIFISAYQYDDKNFLLSVKDSYPAASNNLVNAFDILFSDKPKSETKDLGLPKLNVQLAAALLQILKGKFRLLTIEGAAPDFGFIFPFQFPLAEPSITEDEIEKSTKLEADEPPTQKIPQQLSKIDFEPIQEVSTIDGAKAIVKDIEPQEIVPVPEIHSEEVKEPIKEEIISRPIIQEEPKAASIVESKQEAVSQVKIEHQDQTSAEQTIQSTGNIEKPTEDLFDISKLRCLYIEDQLDSQVLFKVQMKEFKSIQFASGFEEALPLLEKYKFDFILMDINLQGEYNGLDALRLIHKMPQYEKIPIIAVTAYVLPGDKEKFIAAGFQDFIAKPIFHDKMIESLQKIFH